MGDPSVGSSRASPPEERANSYAHDALWTLFGNAVYAVVSWGVIAVIARLGTPAMVGQYVLALAVVSPVVYVTGLQLQSILATDVRDTYEFNVYLGLRLLAALASIAIVTVIISADSSYRDQFAIIVFVLLAKTSEATSEVCYGLFQKKRRQDLAGRSRIVRSCIGLIVLAATLWLTRRIDLALAALAAAWLVILLVYDLRLVRRFVTTKPTLNKRTWPLVRLGVPLGLTLGLLSLSANLPRYILERLEGLETLGFYSAVVFFNVGLAQVSHAACQAASPRLADYFANDVGKFVRVIRRLLVMMLCIGTAYLAVVLSLGEEILDVAYGHEYAKYGHLFGVVAVFGVLDLFSSVLGYSLTAARYFTIQPLLHVGTVLVCALAVFLLTKSNGMVGAAWGVTIASAFAVSSYASTLSVIVYRAKLRVAAIASARGDPT